MGGAGRPPFVPAAGPYGGTERHKTAKEAFDMEAMECIKTRKSIRAFRPQEVPDDTIREIIMAAQRSPSYKNGQPWEVAVVSGAKKDALSELLIKELDGGAPPAPDIPEPEAWPPEVQARMNASMAARGRHLGVDINDPANLVKAKRANFRFYGAPHVLYLYQDSDLPLWSIFDAGLFAQTLMLAAHARGLGTVPQAFAIDYSEVVRKFLGLPAGKRLVLGISFGWPDANNKANKFDSARIPTDEMLRWVR
jgi:nitroreductase